MNPVLLFIILLLTLVGLGFLMSRLPKKPKFIIKLIASVCFFFFIWGLENVKMNIRYFLTALVAGFIASTIYEWRRYEKAKKINLTDKAA